MGTDPAATKPPTLLAKRLDRRAVLKALGAAAAGAALPAPWTVVAHPVTARGTDARSAAARTLRPLATGTTPQAFSAREFAVLERAVDRILPETDTPGAAGAGVHWYLDDAARNEPELRERLARALAELDERCRSSCSSSFAVATPEQQDDALAALDAAEGKAGRAFALLKSATVDAYYRSEIGQIGELGWVGHEFHASFPGGCSHPDPRVHPRPRWGEEGS